MIHQANKQNNINNLMDQQVRHFTAESEIYSCDFVFIRAKKILDIFLYRQRNIFFYEFFSDQGVGVRRQ